MEEKIVNELNEEMDVNDFVWSLYDKIEEKCDYGDDMGQLNECERVFYINQKLITEVNNGGFSQYFYNYSGDFANEIIDKVSKIKAYGFAEICKKALEVFNGEVPTDIEERRKFLDELEDVEIFEELDDAFYDYEDENDLDQLNFAYIQENKDQFDLEF